MKTSDLEHALINSYKDETIAFVEVHPEKFDDVIHLALTNKQPYAWRAALLLVNVTTADDARIRPYLDSIIDFLPDASNGQKRDFLRLLLKMKLHEDMEGKLFDFSLTAWENPKNAPAIRYNAFKMIIKIMENHPELRSEIHHLTEDRYMNSLTKGVKHSVSKILKKLDF